jgi:HEAT repeat protein
MSENGKQESKLTPEKRLAFLESLIEFSESWADNQAIFIQHLSDPDPEVRATAIRGLWISATPDLIDRLIEIANEDPSPMVRARAIGGLGIYVYEGDMADYDFDWGPLTETIHQDQLPQDDFERVKAFLLSAYADEARSLDERRFAIEALGFSSDPQVADLIEQVYQRPEREMKISALFAMGRSGMVRWAEHIAENLHHPDQDIQREAIRAAGEIGLTELGQELQQLTYAEDRDIMLEAVTALGQTGWDEAFERLEELTQDSDKLVANVAENALDDWYLINQIQQEDEDWELDEDWDKED